MTEPEPQPEPIAVKLPKYALDEEVSLYDVLPLLSYDAEDTLKVICDIDYSNIPMADLARYFVKQYNEQRYNDYEGVAITLDTLSKLKSMIIR